MLLNPISSMVFQYNLLFKAKKCIFEFFRPLKPRGWLLFSLLRDVTGYTFSELLSRRDDKHHSCICVYPMQQYVVQLQQYILQHHQDKVSVLSCLVGELEGKNVLKLKPKNSALLISGFLNCSPLTKINELLPMHYCFYLLLVPSYPWLEDINEAPLLLLTQVDTMLYFTSKVHETMLGLFKINQLFALPGEIKKYIYFKGAEFRAGKMLALTKVLLAAQIRVEHSLETE